jgi:meiotic recombination protein SPO11
MLMMGVKAEIQWLDEAGDLTDWLDFKLERLLV